MLEDEEGSMNGDEEDVVIDGADDESRWFTFADGVLFLNHGSYGAVPMPIRQNLSYFTSLMDDNPGNERERGRMVKDTPLC